MVLNVSFPTMIKGIYLLGLVVILLSASASAQSIAPAQWNRITGMAVSMGRSEAAKLARKALAGQLVPTTRPTLGSDFVVESMTPCSLRYFLVQDAVIEELNPESFRSRSAAEITLYVWAQYDLVVRYFDKNQRSQEQQFFFQAVSKHRLSDDSGSQSIEDQYQTYLARERFREAPKDFLKCTEGYGECWIEMSESGTGAQPLQIATRSMEFRIALKSNPKLEKEIRKAFSTSSSGGPSGY
jgi:hypothetical protein